MLLVFIEVLTRITEPVGDHVVDVEVRVQRRARRCHVAGEKLELESRFSERKDTELKRECCQMSSH